MKPLALFATLSILLLTACDEKPKIKVAPISEIQAQATLPPGHPSVDATDPAVPLSEANDSKQTQEATVVSSIDIPQFSYIEVKQNGKTRWLAAATLYVKKGDVIKFDDGSTMSHFESSSLGRTFENITFVNNATLAEKK